ncbi:MULTISPECIES: lipopolysaccharide biosynthesis protein [unclassified Bradyrhizobium]|uniref:lipopolysaccharide biosynthesis protein n=1 Tax=unclassified Bradyrhizobium TaxID=2631580 RepID=UPI00201C979A|nr:MULTISPECIES: lipopolysaccharide biosynthesis protein [unclassified Bradyrhizobium]MCA1495214.1 lipopolysaccharide biosynthesis protein [Bradyrhizobium sp. NBAIM14]MCA1531022.1 lipopolysaccharide biosynthesis protein [Bradyrhizobium sp. NBAIM03]
MAVATGWASIASFVTFALLARLLDPYAFGIFTLAQIVFTLLATLTAAPFNNYVIQQHDLDEDALDTLFWTNLVLCVAIAALIWVSADAYAVLMNAPGAAAPLQCLGIALPVEALATIHLARSLREFGHKIVAIRTLVSTLLGGGLAVLAAYNGLGIWSLILQVWMTSLSNAVSSWLFSRWAPRFRFSWFALRPFLPFCVGVMTSQLLWLILLRIPEVILGRVWGPASVAHYRVGWRLTEAISTAILQPLAGVALPVFSRLKGDPAKFEDAYARFLNIAAIALLPSLLGLTITAKEVVPLLFGPNWTDSIVIVQILGLLGVPLVLNYLVGHALTAVGAVRQLSRLAIVQIVATFFFSLSAAPFGVAAVCLAYVARAYVMMPYQQYLLRVSSSVSFRTCIKAIRAPFLASCVMAAALYLPNHLFRSYLPQDVIYVTIVIPCGALVYILTLYLLDQKAFRAYTRLLGSLS